MSGYGRFALYYDLFTADVDYATRAAFFSRLIRARNPDASLILDLACGTGSMSAELSAVGYDIIGVDASADMLAMAEQKRGMFKGSVMFLRQKAEKLDLYGTVDACVCALDSLNHLPNEASLAKAFSRVSLFMNPDGIFIFDVNTLYKHKHVLGNNSFVYESGNVFCAWRNCYDESDNSVEISLDFFEESGGVYRRYNECFTERYFSDSLIRKLLRDAGFELSAVYDGDSFGEPHEKSQRLLYAAIKA